MRRLHAGATLLASVCSALLGGCAHDLALSASELSPTAVAAPMPRGGVDPHTYRTEIPCPRPDPAHDLVLVPMGQSNAANYAQTPHKAESDRVINYFHGSCYTAADPLVGADGDRGSVWTLAANELVRSGAYERVIIAPVALGGTSIAQWVASAVGNPVGPPGIRPGGMGQVAVDTIRDMTHRGIWPTDYVWVQGEADNNAISPYSRPGAYAAALKEWIGYVNAAAPARFWISITSGCPGQGHSREIRAAQLDAVNGKMVLRGPDLDAISRRFDVCHLTTAGQEQVAAEWARLLQGAGRAASRS